MSKSKNTSNPIIPQNGGNVNPIAEKTGEKLSPMSAYVANSPLFRRRDNGTDKTDGTTPNGTTSTAKTAPKPKTPNGGARATFDDVKRAYEAALESGADSGRALQTLATAVAYSVLKKCIDPQRKTAQTADKVSDSGNNPALVDLKRGIAQDLSLLDKTRYSAEHATHTAYDADGDAVTEIADKDAYKALTDFISDTLTDGIDLVQTAALAILEQAATHATGEKWLDAPYTTRRLSRRVYIQRADSAAYTDVETTPIQEVYRAVRRAVQDSRAVQTDPRNGYTYVEDYTPDGLDTIFYRLGKYTDLGGEDCNGNYTTGVQTVADYDTIIARLDLTRRQKQILTLRMQGKGYKAIATYLGIASGAVQTTMMRLREKCEKIGFTPSMWAEMNEQDEKD